MAIKRPSVSPSERVVFLPSAVFAQQWGILWLRIRLQSLEAYTFFRVKSDKSLNMKRSLWQSDSIMESKFKIIVF